MLRVGPEFGSRIDVEADALDYVQQLRRAAAEQIAQTINEQLPSAAAYVDEDDDVAFDSATSGVSVERMKEFRRSLQDHAGVLADLASAKYPRLRGVLVDTLPWPYFDAGASPAPGKGDVILLTSWLAFLGLWGEWTEYFFLGKAGSLPEEELPKLAQLGKALAGATLGAFPFPILLTCDEVIEKWFGRYRSTERAGFLMNLMRTFVLLHEFGHVALGHTDRLREWIPKTQLSYAEQLRRSEAERDCELAADRFAIEFFRNLPLSSVGTDKGRRSRDEQLLYSAFVLFLLFDLGDLGRSRPGAMAALDSHPPPLIRFTQVAKRVDAPQLERLVRLANILLAA